MDSKLAALIAQDATAFTPQHLRLLVNVVVVIAHADLEIDDDERQSIQLALESSVGHALSAEEVAQQVESARKRISASGSVRFAEQVGVNLREAKLTPVGVRLAYSLAAISGGISEAELARLRALTHGAQLSRDELARVEREFGVQA
jgi:tellurite resistance protein